jgi:hypothetical protein
MRSIFAAAALLLALAGCQGSIFGPSQPGASAQYCAIYPYAEACRQ